MTRNRRSPVAIAVLFLMGVQATAASAAGSAFADFDRKAKAGQRLSVVFFGASLTWGANATDPQLTSFRAIVAQRLEGAYPNAHLKFYDAAIGGTGSQLGVFRFERDVLSRKPDLVFLDFSANDNIHTADRQTLASYEAIVRRILVEANAPVVQVIFPFKWNVQAGTLDGMLRRSAHLNIAKEYGTAAGDAIALAQRRVKSGETTLEQLWPVDGAHPGDAGYRLFADAAWDAFRSAVDERRICSPPEQMLHSDTYMTSKRVRLSQLDPLPSGWRRGKPHVVSAYFDMLMSRWLDDLAIASNRPASTDAAPQDAKGEKEPALEGVAPLRLKLHGSAIMLFGEATVKSGKYRAYVDGKLIEYRDQHTAKMLTEFDAGALARQLGGNTHHFQVIATGLDPEDEHELVIEPVFAEDEQQELRLESVCVAGPGASAILLP